MGTTVAAGQPFTATLTGAGVIVDLGARVERTITREVIVPWVPAVADLVLDIWTASFEVSPIDPGGYLLVWRTELDPPLAEIIDTLSVTAAGIDPGAGPFVWAPGLEDIAAVSPAYTRGGFDDDAPSAGAEQGTFTATTSPTADHVLGLIDAACAEVAGRVGVAIPPRCHALARSCAIWHVAAAISAGKLPAGAEDATGEYRSHITNFRAALDELVMQARRSPLRLV